MQCIKCKEIIDDDSTYCKWCGKKQTKTTAPKRLKRANGMGTAYKIKGRLRKPWRAEFKKVFLGYFPTEAEAWRAISEVTISGVSEKYNYTLKDIYEAWHKEYWASNPSKKAKEEKETAWRRLSVLQDRKMRTLKTSDFAEVILGAQTFCKRVDKKGNKDDPLSEIDKKEKTQRPPKPLSKSGKEAIKKLASQLCTYAMKDDIINKNYALLIKIPDDEDSVSKEPFTREQVDLLWLHTDDETVRIILTMIYTGLRINELFGIERANVHLDDRFMVGGLKTEAGRNRFIPIADKIFKFVQNFYYKSEGCKYLIVNKNGRKVNDSNFRDRLFYPKLEALGIIEPAKYDADGYILKRKITPHSTRYTFFNLSRASGANERLLTFVMGHDNYEESESMYGKLTEDDRAGIRNIVNSIP